MEQLTKLGRLLPVNSRAGPVIRPSNVAILAQRNHRLDSKGLSRLALANCLVLGVMRDVGRAVEDRVNAVTDVSPDDTGVLGLGVLLNRVAKVTVQRPWLDELDRLIKTLSSRLNDAHGVRVSLRPVAHVVRLIQVTVVALMVERDIQVDNVAVHEDALVGNTVADDLVDRGADRLREMVVVQGRWVGLEPMLVSVFLSPSWWLSIWPHAHVALDTLVVYDSVDLVGSDARSDRSSSDVENLSGQPADLAHRILRLLVEDFDLVPVDEGPSCLGNAIGGVVRVGDRLWDFAPRRQRVDGSKGAGVRKVRERVVVAGLWVRFRYYFGRDVQGVLDYTVFLLVH